MQVITNPTVIPTSGEWILGTMPNQFVVVLKNDTEFFKDYDRIAVLARVGERLGDGPEEGKGKFMIHIQGLRTLDGILPDKDIGTEPDAQQFFKSPGFEDRLATALNLWADNITEDQKMEVWMAGNPNPMSVLQALLKA